MAEKASLYEEVPIYNPDVEDFTVTYEKKSYTIHSHEIEKFPKYIAEHIKKHLTTHLMNKRGVVDNPKATLRRIAKEIEVDL